MRKMFIVLLGLMIVSGLLMLACQKQETESKTAGYGEQPAKAGGYGGAEIEAVGEKAKEVAGAYGEKAPGVATAGKRMEAGFVRANDHRMHPPGT